ncbi:TPA: MFS transporter [Stenotrophomonas maltophilia]
MPPSPLPSHARRRWPDAILLVASLGCTMTVLETNAVAVALPGIARDLHAGFADVEWVVSAYILSFTSLLLPAGAVADRYGRRRVLLIGIALFALTSLLCALAPGAALLYLARALQGVGAAFLLAPSLSIIGHTYHQGIAKDTAWAFWGTAMGVMMVLSPLIGGLLSALWGWRAVFIAILPFLALLGYGTLRWIPESSDSVVRPLDPPGIVTFSAAIFGIVLFLVEGLALGWSSAPALTGLGLAAVMAAAFVVVERTRPHPMVDLGLLANPRFVGALIAMIGYSVSAQVMASMLPQYLQNGIGLGVLAAGAGMLPFAAAMLLFPGVGRRLGRRLSSPAVLAIGLSVTAAGNAVAGLAAWCQLPWLALAAMVVIGAGGGLLNGETSKAIIGTAPRERAGMASGISATTRFVGILLGFTVLSSALSLGIRRSLSAAVPPHDVLPMADAIAAGTYADAHAATFARVIYSHGFANALWTSACAALLASLAVMLLGRTRPVATAAVLPHHPDSQTCD